MNRLIVLGLTAAACSSADPFVQIPEDVDRIAVIELVEDATSVSPADVRSTTALLAVEDGAVLVEAPDGAIVVVGYGAAQLEALESESLERPIRFLGVEPDDIALPDPAWSVRVSEGGEATPVSSLPGLAVVAPGLRRGGWVLEGDVGRPDPRYRYGITYDPVRERTVVFGGDNAAAGRLGDTWELTDRWRAVTGTVAPDGRVLGELAFDPVSQRVIMFGGYDGAAHRRDTWAFDGAWTELVGIEAPPVRGGHRMVLDERRGRIVLFGGDGDGRTLADTWLFEGDRWRELPLTDAPTGRRDFGFVYLPERETVLLVGGADEHEPAVYADAWASSADGWRRAPEFDLPNARRSFALVWDPVLRRLVLHGGWDEQKTWGDTLIHDGTQWRTARLERELPPRRRHSALYVPSLGSVMTVGGQSGIDTALNDVHTFRLDER